MAEIGFVGQVGRLKRALRRDFETRAAPLGVTASQFHVLRTLWEEDGIQTSALSRGTPYDCATMTGVLDRLESRGLVRRERSSKDRRAVRIYLTPAGKALEEPLMRAVAQLNERAMAGLSPSEREELVRMLDHVGGNLDAW